MRYKRNPWRCMLCTPRARGECLRHRIGTHLISPPEEDWQKRISWLCVHKGPQAARRTQYPSRTQQPTATPPAGTPLGGLHFLAIYCNRHVVRAGVQAGGAVFTRCRRHDANGIWEVCDGLDFIHLAKHRDIFIKPILSIKQASRHRCIIVLHTKFHPPNIITPPTIYFQK